jgi:4a-hydroxytetrahydrobiopterin dehydratase
VSESGWRAFLAASGIEEWAVLHGGPTAVYRTSSLAEAAALAQAIAAVPGLDGTHAQINLLSDRVTVRLTREVWKIEDSHVERARAISAVARAKGAVADRAAIQEVQVAVSAKPDAIDLDFWRAVLGYAPMQSDNAIDPLGNSSTVWMQELNAEKPLRHAMHIDVSVPREQAAARLAAAVAAGGVIVDASHAPSYWILADRSGNKVCIAAWPDGAVDPSETSAD